MLSHRLNLPGCVDILEMLCEIRLGVGLVADSALRAVNEVVFLVGVEASYFVIFRQGVEVYGLVYHFDLVGMHFDVFAV